MITFTDAAAEKVREVVQQAGEECAGLRVRAFRLGRYTFRYQLHLVRAEEVREDDVRVQAGEVTAYLDPQSARWMEGSTVDWVTIGGQSGFQISNPAAEPKWDDPVAKKVQKVLDHKVIPALAQHGGWIELSRVEGDTAYVILGGGCQGCASANETLKLGVERILTEEVPEINRVVDETDHGAGTSPYMAR